MAEELSLKLQEKSVASAGSRPTKSYLLERRETDILLTGYSTLMRAAVIDRWRELEAQVAKPANVNLSDPAALRSLLLGYTEQVMQLEHQVGTQAVKIAEDAKGKGVYEAGRSERLHQLPEVLHSI